MSCNILHMIFSITYSPHGLYVILHHMLDIMSPCVILLMVFMTFSTCLYRVSICYAPHAWHGINHMLDIMCPYAILHIVWMHSPYDIFHMHFSTWFAWHTPHAAHHVSIWYSPHACRDILHMLYCMSPFAILLMVCMAFSTWLNSCLHMWFSPWFAWHSPHD